MIVVQRRIEGLGRLPRLDESSSLCRGLLFASTSVGGHLWDAVSKRVGTRSSAGRTVTRAGDSPLFGTGAHVDFTAPSSLDGSLPITIAWEQEPRATTGFNTVVDLRPPVSASNSFLIYESATQSGYQLCVGPRDGGGNSRQANFEIGLATNNLADRFVLVAPNGLATTITQYILYRNGVRMAATYGSPFGAATPTGFRIGALLGTAGDPFEGALGSLRIAQRAWSDDEARRWTAGEVDVWARRSVVVSAAAASGVSTVSTDLAGAYALAAATSADLAGVYALQVAVQADLAGEYVAVNAVPADHSGSYAVIGVALADLGGAYDVLGLVSADLSGAYDIESAGIVSADLAGGYAVISSSAVDLPGEYSLLASAQADLGSAYHVVQATASDLPGEYSVLDSAQADLAGVYALGGAVVASLPGAYAVRGAALRDLAGSYSILAAGAGTGATAEEVADAVWRRVLESGLTAEQMLRIVMAPLAGRADGIGSATERYYGQDGVTPRVTATFDPQGNRTNVIVDGAA